MVAAYSAASSAHYCFCPNQPTVKNNPQGKTLTFVLGTLCRLKRYLSYRLIPPRCLFVLVLLSSAVPALSAEVTLAWDPNHETDLEGYCAYFKKDALEFSFSMFGCVTLQELNDPKTPQFVVTGLERGATYCFAVTAYDKSGNESNYSNAVCGQVIKKAMPWLSLLLDD